MESRQTVITHPASDGSGWTKPAWIAVFGETRGLYVHEPARRWSPAVAEGNGCRVLFDGFLYNRSELLAHFRDRNPQELHDAELVRLGYQEWGEAALLRLRGVFALAVWHAPSNRLLCARDPVGLHPLFYADIGRSLVLSPSIDAILEYPGVRGDLNRPGLVDHLARRWLQGEETYFAAVKRIPPCYAMRIHDGNRSLYRFWDPVPPERTQEWIDDDAAPECFKESLERAVARCLSVGPAAITLSGGIDSTSVAMAATDLCRRNGQRDPLALSLVLPGPDVDDANTQRAVAGALALPQIQLSFDEATGSCGALAATLELSRTMAAPVTSMLRPALSQILLEGSRRGCQVILTGDGADEWVAGNPHMAADFLAVLDLRGLFGLWRTLSQSFPQPVEVPLHRVLWRWGARPLLRDVWYASPVRTLVQRAAPSAMARLRRRRAASATPSWIAPEPTLRAEIDRREAESFGKLTASKIRNHSQRFARSMLDLPQKWLFHEENFALASHAGVRMGQPFWDADLIDLMMKIRPQVRTRDGWTKYLLRDPLVRRFPGLGFERRLKSYTGNAILSALVAGAADARRALGGTWRLEELGVIDSVRVRWLLDRALAGSDHEQWVQAWNLLNLETWARAHSP